MITKELEGKLDFCEDWTCPPFTGDRDNESEVKAYLDEYLPIAESLFDEARCEYESMYY